MKKNFRFLAVLFAAIVVFGSCSREDQPNVKENFEGDYLVLNLATPETRSSLTDKDGLKFAWEANDVLHCMYVVNGEGHTAKGTVQEGGATLKVEKPANVDVANATLYAYYNASVTDNSLSCTEGKVTVELADAQFSSSDLNKVASHQAMYGSVELEKNETLQMHHIGSVMKITATEAINGNVTLDNVGNNNFVAKKGTFNFTEETPKFTATEAQSKIEAIFNGESKVSYVWFVPNAKGNSGVLAVTAGKSSVALGNYSANLGAGKVYPIDLTLNESKEITAVHNMKEFVVNPDDIPWCGDNNNTYSPLFSSGDFNGKFSTTIDTNKPLAIYFRGREEFKKEGTPYFYAWNHDGEGKVENQSWPGKAMERVKYPGDDRGLDYFVITLTKDEVSKLVENNNLNLIFNNGNPDTNKWQTGNLKLIP